MVGLNLPGFVKLNTDAAFDNDHLCGSTGVIIRDYKGKFIAAASSNIPVV